jgi:hypothetical protein
MSRGFLGISRLNSDDDEGFNLYGGSNDGSFMHSYIQQIVLDNINNQIKAEKATQRQSVVEDVNNILGTPQRYASVEDAVSDMRERTGLNSYLQRINSSKKELLKKITADINAYANSNSNSNSNNIPECLSKYDINDEIVSFLKNTCQNNHGLSVTIPQLQDDLLHIFGGKYKIQPEDVWNDETARFINDFIIDARSTAVIEPFNNQIGVGLGNDMHDTSQDDHFFNLEPSKK